MEKLPVKDTFKGPGSWFTSVIPHLLVPDLADAILTTRARRVLILNVASAAHSIEWATERFWRDRLAGLAEPTALAGAMPPGPRICFIATACCGCEGTPG